MHEVYTTPFVTVKKTFLVPCLPPPPSHSVMHDGNTSPPPSCDSPSTSHRFTLVSSNACQVGQKPGVLRPGIIGL